MDTLALIRSIASPTPTEELEVEGIGTVLAKREDLGPNRAFKWRGAIAACLALREKGATGIVAASTGNHGAAVAWAAQRLGLEAHVVVPRGAVAAKCERIASQGAELHEVGNDLHAAAAFAIELAQSRGMPYFEDGAVEAQLAGAGTVAQELDCLDRVGTIFIPVACGALAAGICSVVRGDDREGPRLVGVQAENFSRLAAEFDGRRYTPNDAGTIADGLADDRLVQPAMSVCLELLDEIVTVSEAEIEAGMRCLWRAARIRAEGAGAAAMAGLLAADQADLGLPLIVVSGGNLEPDLAQRVLSEDPQPSPGSSS